LGLRGLQIEENAKRLLASLSGLQRHVENFSQIYEKLGNQMRLAQQTYFEGDRKLERARDALDDLAHCAPSEGSLEPAATDQI
jgi:DNA anti-recombination protein RmuC